MLLIGMLFFDKIVNFGSVFMYKMIIEVMIIEIDSNVNMCVVLFELGNLNNFYINFCIFDFGNVNSFLGLLLLFRMFLIVLIVFFLSLKNFIFLSRIFGVSLGG